MSPPTVFQRMEADRETLRDHLNLLQQELTAHETTALPRAQLTTYLEEASETIKLLADNHKQLRLFAPAATDMNPYVADYQLLYKMATRLHAGYHGIVMAFPPPTTTTTTASSSSTSAAAPPPPPPKPCIKLPPLELPKFSGNLQEWVSFRDMFVTAVHTSSLTKVEKLTQLKALLTGEAARQIRSLILCDANYDIAWKSLQDRYENNRELLFSIIRRLINQPVITSASAQSIRSLIDTTNECVRSLEILAIPTQHWDAILLYLLFSKMDSTSRELWEQSLPDTSIPPLSKMTDFLEQRARALAASSAPPQQQRQQHKPPQSVRNHHVATSTCKLGCSSPHPTYRCPAFQNFTVPQRQEAAKQHHLCTNCLFRGHNSSACPSTSSCKICSRKHHTMLHLDGGGWKQQQQHTTQQDSSKQRQADSSSSVSSHHITPVGELKTGILATARVKVISNSGNNLYRSLIDPGSTNSYITEKAARQLNLPLRPCNIPMTGLSSAPVGTARHVTTFNFTSRFNNVSPYSVTAIVVKSISANIPVDKLISDNWSHLQNLQLADPHYHLPEKCDILLGTDIFWTTLENEKISGSSGQPHAIKTSLGWLVAGANSSTTPVVTFNTSADLDFQLRRFWEQEEVPEAAKPSAEEEECEQHFATTHKRDPAGRFIVNIPFKKDISKELGSSRQAAVKRFLSMEKRFANPTTKNIKIIERLTSQWSQYKDFMREYEQLGHMQLIPENEVNVQQPTYYIPHHSVLKESSTTTKLRVVFDASAATSTGSSLNDCMMVGPQLQDNITDIMLRFRLHPIAFTADIAKMYRQISVTPEDAELQRIVWREHPSLPLRDYRLQTVTYGTSSAPYLAVKCLQQLAKDEETRYPAAAKIARRDFYVDDAASGCQSLEEAKTTVKELMDLCMSGGFQLRKWTTNSKELLNFIPADLRETNSLVEVQQDTTIKTLGVFWNPIEDIYTFRLNLPPDMPGSYTKRIILSDIAKIYDPLGWLAPAIITYKIFMQDLWKTQLDWDEKLPPPLQDQWLNMKTSLRDIERIRIPRCVTQQHCSSFTLVGCSDASTKALSAAVYLCCESNNQPPTCHLLTSKTRVAPVKHVSLPRLELNAAVLLSELLKTTLTALQLNITTIRAFTDSTITFHWINSSPSRWKIYVRRRVQVIQENVPTATWFHIPGDRNPADCASRGIGPEDLLHHPLWWNGVPEFHQPYIHKTDLLEDDLRQMDTEAQPVASHHTQPGPLPPVFTKFSSFRTFQRVMAYALRFINNASRHPIKFSGVLCTSELANSRCFILRLLQHHQWPLEYNALFNKTTLPASSSLLKLQPFMSEEGLIRVGGRLLHANVPYARKHPILLPRSSQVTTSIIWDLHHNLLHGGATIVLATLQHQYWITNGRDAVRFVIRKCAPCARHQAILMKQVMGDLPSHRVNPARPFSKVGVDYAGPISIRPMVRSKVSLKCWLAIFVCFATRAIHIEVVSSLSTDCFLAALRRFVSRRGCPSDIFSDCGTNFKGSDKALNDIIKLSQQKEVQDSSSSQAIKWHFNPAGAPHFGGLWEAGVKSIKFHLRRVMGSSVLTYEEMHTLVVQIEGILNSRPLVPASNDPSDLNVLTPAHFLIGSTITGLPEQNHQDTKECHLRRWQLLQHQQQLFWKRWSSEYLTRLQQRPKWWKPSPNLEVGHLVIIKDERLPPLKWKLGRVLAVHPGADGHVRVATLKTADGEIKRPVVKLSLLPITSNNEI